ncbi:IS5 family transposase [Thiorhodovibrio frisius]|uniref:IS5 family transposase n=1 Tax=Thiorhodovibrio frisius TaxID=631362 RepID=UPI002B25D6F9|nr:IS5 family transposase [Thiorhodovibrio frisius]WPL21786.1 Transposase DDE domain protein [Thiorhodovibrio frisius]
MQQQLTFAQLEYQHKKKVTRRDRFLAEMEKVVPWEELLEELGPHYYQEHNRGRGRPPVPLERMLRLYFLQQWFNLADEALEDTVYDSQSFRGFLGIDLLNAGVPDATLLPKFRRLLEANDLGGRLLERVNAHLSERGLMMNEGTMVDATIVAAPSSTKNASKARDPEMHQTKKGNQWHFGMKAHIGADLFSGAVHSVHCTAANVADVSATDKLLHGQESTVFADAGYIGADKRDELSKRKIRWQIAAKRGRVKALEDGPIKEQIKAIEQQKASLRARVEHPFHVIKNLFGHRKVRYRGLKKNNVQWQVLFALSNLYLLRKPLLA